LNQDVHMRLLPLVLFALLATACDRGETTGFTLRGGKVERVNGCHVRLDHAGGKDGLHAGLRFACGVPSSALTEERWWGDEPEPLAFTVDVGDCILLDQTFYCVEEIKRGESASFRATYRKATRAGDIIERIREK